LGRLYGLAAVQGGYPERTRRNAAAADATLVILEADLPTGGTALTMKLVNELGKPLHLVRLESPEQLAEAATWLRGIDPKTLNVAGPRESESEYIGAKTETFLAALLQRLGFRSVS